MSTIRRFEDIPCWKTARAMNLEVLAILENGIKDAELAAQIRTASNSVMANIAEGFRKRTDRDFAHFLSIAHGSASEVQSHLYTILDRGRIDLTQFERVYSLAESCSKQLYGFERYLRKGER